VRALARTALVLAAVVALSACSDAKPAATTTVPATEPTTTAATDLPTSSTSTTVAVRALRTNEEIAATITRTERGLRADGTADADLRPLAEDQQRAYRAAAAAAESSRLDTILGLIPSELRAAARANITAGMELRALTKPRTSLPPWHIVEPASATELLGYYREAERRYGVGWEYLAAVHLTETRMGRIRGDSTAGARGPMQFLPSTWKQYGEGGDIESNHDAILAAARLLKHNGAPSRMHDALFSYNRSEHYVTAVSLYAAQMRANERAYVAYHHWQVWYRMTTGDVLLPLGYPDSPAVPSGA
jgi:membrane-bound lytic murein transglycosylase B